MLTNIVCQVPWHCGFKDGCEQGWHLGSYWTHEDGGYTYDAFTDGDHEEIDSVPETEDVDAAWRAYYESCRDSGTDPLYQFNIAYTIKRPIRYTCEIGPGIGGLYLRRARVGTGPWLVWHQLPVKLKQYLQLAEDLYKPEPQWGPRLHVPWPTLAEMIAATQSHDDVEHISTRHNVGRFVITLEGERPRGAAVLARAVRSAARKALRLLEARS